MNYNSLHERCDSARKLEALLLLASGIGTLTAALIFLKYGMLPSLAVLLLSVVAFALGRLLDLVAELLRVVGKIQERQENQPPKTAADARSASLPPAN